MTLRKLLTNVLSFAGALGGIATIAGTIGFLTPQLELFNQVQPLTFAGFAVVFALSLFAGSRALFLWAAAGLLINAALFSSVFATTAIGASSASAPALTVLAVNVRYENTAYDEVASAVRAANPDIILLSEYLTHHDENLIGRLQQQYPYVASCPRLNTGCDVAIYSRWPFVGDPEATAYSAQAPSAIVTHVRLPAGTSVTVAAVHVDFPGHLAKQSADISWLTEKASAWQGPVVIAGDFNLTPWTAMFRRLQRATGLVRHGTLQRSWPVQSFAPNVPFVLLDNVLTTPDIKSVSFRTGPQLGSDHLPVVATLELPAH
jgi:endonuclease/exonuclease/phosphatase (EEP) superfamily protein YafD